MKRRAFIAMLGGAAWTVVARAQQPAVPVIGVLYSVSPAQWEVPIAGFHRGLGETGFIEGRNVAVEYRWAEGHLDRMPTLAADLIGRKVAVILVGGNVGGVRAAIAYELVINLKTAKALGIDVPASVLARADEVIE